MTEPFVGIYQRWPKQPVVDPGLQIKRKAWSSRPWDKGGGSLKKTFFWPFGPQFGLKITGGRPPPPPLERPLTISPFNRLKRLFVVQQYFGQLNIYFKHEVWALDHKVFYFLLLNRRISFPLWQEMFDHFCGC